MNEVKPTVKPTVSPKITFKNIYAFFQGNGRKLREDMFNSLPVHIKKQVEERVELVKEKSPECLSGKCVKCGCDTPELFYADKACDGDCYPIMNHENK
jgi:hypothetical protein